MKKTLSLIFSVLLILLCFTACGDNNADGGIRIPEENLTRVSYGSFSKFTAIDLNGNKVTEDIFKGKKLTMINIWATFCSPCIGEMPYLETLNKEYADKDFSIKSIYLSFIVTHPFRVISAKGGRHNSGVRPRLSQVRSFAVLLH